MTANDITGLTAAAIRAGTIPREQIGQMIALRDIELRTRRWFGRLGRWRWWFGFELAVAPKPKQ